MDQNAALNIKFAIAGVISALTALWGWFGWMVVASGMPGV